MADEFKNIEKVMERGAQLYADAIRDSAIQQRLFKTGQLAQSIQGETYSRQGKIGIQVSMEDYGLYQDSGINGIKQTVPKSGYSFYPPGQFRSKVIGGPLPFAVRKSIAENGLKPRPFIVRGLTQVTENFLVPQLTEAGVQDIEQYVELAVQGLDKVS
jgi:hypothetical protein